MEIIKKEYNVGVLKIKARISDGFVVLVTNHPEVTKQIYLQSKKEGQQVAWNERIQACTQFYPALLAKEIEDITDREVIQIKKEGKNLFQNLPK
jgi:hypothetical protein